MKEPITLGKLLELLKEKKKQGMKSVRLDHPELVPREIASYRGYYNQAALGFDCGYSAINDGKKNSINSLIKEVNDAIGKTFTGWKGGEYVFTKDTPLWISNEGCAGSYQIVEVRRHNLMDEVAVLMTERTVEYDD